MGPLWRKCNVPYHPIRVGRAVCWHSRRWLGFAQPWFSLYGRTRQRNFRSAWFQDFRSKWFHGTDIQSFNGYSEISERTISRARSEFPVVQLWETIMFRPSGRGICPSRSFTTIYPSKTWNQLLPINRGGFQRCSTIHNPRIKKSWYIIISR